MTTELVTGGAREGAAELVFTVEQLHMDVASLDDRRAVLQMFLNHHKSLRRLETDNDVERVTRQEQGRDFFVVRNDTTREIIGFASGSADYDREAYEDDPVIPIPDIYSLGPLVMRPEYNERSIRVVLGTTRNRWAKEAGHKRLTSK